MRGEYVTSIQNYILYVTYYQFDWRVAPAVNGMLDIQRGPLRSEAMRPSAMRFVFDLIFVMYWSKLYRTRRVARKECGERLQEQQKLAQIHRAAETIITAISGDRPGLSDRPSYGPPVALQSTRFSCAL